MSIFNSLGSNYSLTQIGNSMLPVSAMSHRRLQNTLKKAYQAETVCLTYKCREAITLILRQLELPEGSYVAINGYTCYVVYAAVVATGLKPYLLDIHKDNLNFSVDTLKQALVKEPKIRAVIVQNTLGTLAPIEKIKAVCDSHKLPLIEDLAHSAGLIYPDGKKVGSVGVGAALSFSQDKIIDAVSGGAAVLFRPKTFEPTYTPVSLWQRWQAYWYPLNTWFIRKTHSMFVGKLWLKFLKTTRFLPNQMAGNPRFIRGLPNRQAHMALRAILDLPRDLEHRQRIAAIYEKAFPEKFQIPQPPGSVYIRFPLLIDDPRGLERYLKIHNIHIGGPWYDAVIAPSRYMPYTDYQPGQCPEAEYVAAHIVNLPTHINLSEAQAHKLAQKVNQWLSK